MLYHHKFACVEASDEGDQFSFFLLQEALAAKIPVALAQVKM